MADEFRSSANELVDLLDLNGPSINKLKVYNYTYAPPKRLMLY